MQIMRRHTIMDCKITLKMIAAALLLYIMLNMAETHSYQVHDVQDDADFVHDVVMSKSHKPTMVQVCIHSKLNDGCDTFLHQFTNFCTTYEDKVKCANLPHSGQYPKAFHTYHINNLRPNVFCIKEGNQVGSTLTTDNWLPGRVWRNSIVDLMHECLKH